MTEQPQLTKVIYDNTIVRIAEIGGPNFTGHEIRTIIPNVSSIPLSSTIRKAKILAGIIQSFKIPETSTVPYYTEQPIINMPTVNYYIDRFTTPKTKTWNIRQTIDKDIPIDTIIEIIEKLDFPRVEVDPKIKELEFKKYSLGPFKWICGEKKDIYERTFITSHTFSTAMKSSGVSWWVFHNKDGLIDYHKTKLWLERIGRRTKDEEMVKTKISTTASKTLNDKSINKIIDFIKKEEETLVPKLQKKLINFDQLREQQGAGIRWFTHEQKADKTILIIIRDIKSPNVPVIAGLRLCNVADKEMYFALWEDKWHELSVDSKLHDRYELSSPVEHEVTLRALNRAMKSIMKLEKE